MDHDTAAILAELKERNAAQAARANDEAERFEKFHSFEQAGDALAGDVRPPKDWAKLLAQYIEAAERAGRLPRVLTLAMLRTMTHEPCDRLAEILLQKAADGAKEKQLAAVLSPVCESIQDARALRDALGAIHERAIDNHSLTMQSTANEPEPEPADTRASEPLKDTEATVDEFIRTSGTATLKTIAKHTGLEESTIKTHIIPALKLKRGLLSRPYRYAKGSAGRATK